MSFEISIIVICFFVLWRANRDFEKRIRRIEGKLRSLDDTAEDLIKQGYADGSPTV